MRLQVRYNFYPRPPRGGRPHHGEGHLRQPDFYPRPPRGGRRACWAATRVPALISIHALREEGDARQSRSTSTAEISIHALREEGDIFASCFSVHCIQFLSTPSARRATRHLEAVKGPVLISIHALREEGDPRWFSEGDGCESISIHALREEGDLLALCRGQLFHISIHALREEGDQTSTAATAAVKTFLSTPSARRATGDQRRSCPDQKISIHALREEGDFFEPVSVLAA